MGLGSVCFRNIARDLKLAHEEMSAGLFDCKDDVILHLCFKLIDIDGLMIEAALLSNDGALLCEQVMHNKVLRRVVDDFFIIECEGD